jgi:hypothetical protein
MLLSPFVAAVVDWNSTGDNDRRLKIVLTEVQTDVTTRPIKGQKVLPDEK